MKNKTVKVSENKQTNRKNKEKKIVKVSHYKYLCLHARSLSVTHATR